MCSTSTCTGQVYTRSACGQQLEFFLFRSSCHFELGSVCMRARESLVVTQKSDKLIYWRGKSPDKMHISVPKKGKLLLWSSRSVRYCLAVIGNGVHEMIFLSLMEVEKTLSSPITSKPPFLWKREWERGKWSSLLFFSRKPPMCAR